jgi:hypothetical protein
MMHIGLIPSVHNMENCGTVDELFQPVSRPKESFIGRVGPIDKWWNYWRRSFVSLKSQCEKLGLSYFNTRITKVTKLHE